MTKDKIIEFKKLNICILTISSSRDLSNDRSGDLLEERVLSFGHKLFARKVVKDNKILIQETVTDWSKNKGVDVIITSGGTGLTETDVTPESLEEIFEKTISGFSIIFQFL